MSGIENRKYPRRTFAHLVSVLFRGDVRISSGVAIGEGGLSLAGELTYKEGDQVVLSFYIPGERILVVRGEYRNQFKNAQNQMGMGFQFLNIDFDSKRLVRDFVAQRGNSEAERKLNQEIA